MLEGAWRFFAVGPAGHVQSQVQSVQSRIRTVTLTPVILTRVGFAPITFAPITLTSVTIIPVTIISVIIIPGKDSDIHVRNQQTVCTGS